MTMPFASKSVVLAGVVALLAPGIARAEVTLAEGTPEVGRVHLVASASAPGVRIVEDVDGADIALADGAEARTDWTCESTRTFAAIAGEERSAPLTVTTPSCEDRIRVRSRPNVGLHEDLRISVVDRWALGDLPAAVCAVRPDQSRTCHQVALPQDQNVAHTVFAASAAGRWRIEATTPAGVFTRAVTVVRKHYPAGGPTVLFTGDSMMLATRHVLQHRLPGNARTIDDIYVGSGITRPFVIDWATLPARQVRAYHPDATVISLGMGDGRELTTPAGTVECCGTDYVAAYARHARAIMRAYARHGDGAVVWLNEPFTRDPARWPEEAAVNAALALAAQGLTRVRLVDLATTFTPGGAYRKYLDRDGVRVRVRTSDGIHLTRAGARIASRLVMARLRRLGVIGPSGPP